MRSPEKRQRRVSLEGDVLGGCCESNLTLPSLSIEGT